MRGLTKSFGWAGVLTLATLCQDASAQELAAAAVADLAAGVEGGASDHASGIRRTRTTLRLGVEGWLEAFSDNMLALAARIELEPVASIGADFRYQRRLLEDFVLHGGITAVIAPKHMLGATFGAGYRVTLSETVAIEAGPSLNVYLTGADLPAGQLLWQGMLSGGFRAAF